MATKVAINGFGRIGRAVTRILLERKGDLDLVAVNDLADAKSLAHLFKYDTVMGKWGGTVEMQGDSLVINGKSIKVLAVRNPAELPWKEMGVEIVVESTGIFRTKESPKGGYGDHLKAGAKKVVLTVPAKDDIDATIVLGVNDDVLTSEVDCVSNASCTTNCLAPLAKALHGAFGIERGLMTTVHGYTNDQRVSDMIHSDLRRARAAALNIIPTTTGAAKAVGKVIPELNGKLDGFALRVPFDSLLTLVIGRTVKVISWYDNEWGYSNRTVDIMEKLAKM
ncbi:MAG: type I glyceraldehyde-3-phosphate dehydrogenase [Planctomycetota bacterium]|jgi:glyceraldehyde 3-phosphate dehydrogenase